MFELMSNLMLRSQGWRDSKIALNASVLSCCAHFKDNLLFSHPVQYFIFEFLLLLYSVS